ncbi:unnamed protein product [Zymoseptoria tritici ST99CH_1A5]|uniref:Uncharacterized protein n=2 Tax=Zymoseptoria tritici TaxID=1047171 RepID=A0A2H1FY69_ZYMTR|nr:unnamed protein product [Zymoseptoria tritici ST99CH_1E4]SMR47523.1 unnamed protein product [Zymoseptoria tritici ST99CH_3D1]SMY21423.1 unnamed protein product [Zymoseptoria tritici ST99CH_1A5]
MDSTWELTSSMAAFKPYDRPSSARPLLVCGIHRRLSDKQIEKRTSKVIYHRSHGSNEKPGSCICDYTEFPELLSERLNSQKMPCSIPSHGKSFMDLPTEMRIKCYEAALISPDSIEFCPMPFNFTGRAPSGKEAQDAFDDAWCPVEVYHTQLIARFCARAKLLRVSKTINAEATPVFYGGNHFAFSNISGWVGLLLFMYRIGMHNCRLLRRMTVCHPLLMVKPQSLKADDHFRRSIVALFFPSSAHSWGFLPARWFDHGRPMDGKLVLEKISKLKELNIIVDCPQTMGMWDGEAERDLVEGFARPFLDENKFVDLQVTVLEMWEEGKGKNELFVEGEDGLAPDVVRVHNEWSDKGRVHGGGRRRRWKFGKDRLWRRIVPEVPDVDDSW